MAVLPHRYPFILIDKVIELNPGVSIVAIKNVSAGEPYFQGHFPQQPIMPGVLIVEAMAQAGAIVMADGLEGGKIPLLGGIDKARFRRQVEPGDQLVLKGAVKQTKKNVGVCVVESFVDDALVAQAQLTMVSADSPAN